MSRLGYGQIPVFSILPVNVSPRLRVKQRFLEFARNLAELHGHHRNIKKPDDLQSMQIIRAFILGRSFFQISNFWSFSRFSDRAAKLQPTVASDANRHFARAGNLGSDEIDDDLANLIGVKVRA